MAKYKLKAFPPRPGEFGGHKTACDRFWEVLGSSGTSLKETQQEFCVERGPGASVLGLPDGAICCAAPIQPEFSGAGKQEGRNGKQHLLLPLPTPPQQGRETSKGAAELSIIKN